MSKAITPVLTVTLMTGMVLIMAASAYVFISGQQDTVIGQTNAPQLKTVNITCSRQDVTWWIENTASHGVQDAEARIVFTDEGGLNSTLFIPDQPVPTALQQGHSRAQLSVTPNDVLELGHRYQITFDVRNADVTGTCRAGAPWWDVNWDHRRRVELENGATDAQGQTSVQINPEQLVRDGKLQPHCQDLRVVVDGTATPYNTSIDPVNCASTDTVQVTFTAPADPYNTYLYYGHPGADQQPVSIASSSASSPLADEETVGLPGQ